MIGRYMDAHAAGKKESGWSFLKGYEVITQDDELKIRI